MEFSIPYTFSAEVIARTGHVTRRVTFSQTRQMVATIAEAPTIHRALEVRAPDRRDARLLHAYEDALWEIVAEPGATLEARVRSFFAGFRRGDAVSFDRAQYRSVEQSTEEEVRAAIAERARGLLLVQGDLYQRVPEPRYHARLVFGAAPFWQIDVVEAYDPSEPRRHYFRADQQAELRSYCKAIADVRVLPGDEIVVHDPNAVRCQPAIDGVVAREVDVNVQLDLTVRRRVLVPQDATMELLEREAEFGLDLREDEVLAAMRGGRSVRVIAARPAGDRAC